LRISCGTAEEAAEKVRKKGEGAKGKLAGAKARLIPVGFIGPAKAVPLLQSPSRLRFSAACEAETF
jgi:hypothetical protein